MAFDPTPHLVKVKGGQLYLPVKDRLIWLREEHPDAAITTEMVHLDLELQLAIFRAQVTVRATAPRPSATSRQDGLRRLRRRPSGVPWPPLVLGRSSRWSWTRVSAWWIPR